MLARFLDTTPKRLTAAGIAALAVVIGIVAALLASDGADATAPETTTTTTEAPATTEAPTTTLPQVVAPLTGLAGDYEATIGRPALFVKLDNHVQARPHAGINQADIVFEEQVEGNITRLAAVFHSRQPDAVGPVRSTRTTDIDLAALFGSPVYASSGGNSHVLGALSRSSVVDVGHNRGGAGFWRERGRPGPHDLFARPADLWSRAGDAGSVPAPIFTYRAEGDPLPTGATPAGGVALRFGGAEISRFTWDAASGSWHRSHNGAPHVDTDGVQVAPANVVVLEIGYRFSSGATESSPHGVTTGEGRALVLTAGHVVEGRWVRPGPGDPLQLLAADGSPIALTPGQTFVELPPAGGATIL